MLAWVPIPNHFVQLPGPAVSTSDQVEVKGKPRPPGGGDYFITTLYRRPANAWWSLRAMLQSDWSFMSEDSEQPRAASPFAEEDGHRTLRHVVYQTCGLEPISRVTILDLTDDSPLLGKVEPGDQLRLLQGVPINTPAQVREIVQALEPKESVSLTMAAPSGAVYQVRVKPAQIRTLSSRGLGVVLSRQWDDSNLPKIYFRSGSYQGTSSELMLGLELCERLLSINLRKGRRIAGSGGLAINGRVTPVQGLEQKLSSARQVKAEVFFVPEEEISALAAHLENPEIAIVPVGSIHEAITWLQRNPNRVNTAGKR